LLLLGMDVHFNIGVKEDREKTNSVFNVYGRSKNLDLINLIKSIVKIVINI